VRNARKRSEPHRQHVAPPDVRHGTRQAAPRSDSRTAGDSRALWTLTNPEAAIFQIAEHCNGEQVDELIGAYPGIIVSDRRPGYEHHDPEQRQVCWSHLQRDFRRHSEGLAEQKTSRRAGP